MTRAKAYRCAVCLGIVGSAIGGCAGLSVLGTYLREAPWVLAGGDDQRLILITDDAATAQQRAIGTSSKDVYTLDTSTMTANKLVSGISTPAVTSSDWTPQIAADGRYVAWIDAGESDVVLYDTSLDVQTRLDVLAGSDTCGVFLMDGRLLINRRISGAYEVVVVNIASGAQTVVSDSWLYGGFALIGDVLVLRNDKNTEDVKLLGLELSANIERVDLSSGQRQMIAQDSRVPGDGGALFAAGSRVVWCDYPEGSFNLRIRSYDLASGKLENVKRKANPDGGFARLCGVSGDTILLEKRTGNQLLGEQVWLECMGFDGQSLGVVQLGTTADPTWFYAPGARFVGDLVVWSNPRSGAIETWDPVTGARTTFDQAAS